LGIGRQPALSQWFENAQIYLLQHSSADSVDQLRKAFYPEEGWGFLASLRFQGEIWLSLRHWVCKGAG